MRGFWVLTENATSFLLANRHLCWNRLVASIGTMPTTPPHPSCNLSLVAWFHLHLLKKVCTKFEKSSCKSSDTRRAKHEERNENTGREIPEIKDIQTEVQVPRLRTSRYMHGWYEHSLKVCLPQGCIYPHSRAGLGLE